MAIFHVIGDALVSKGELFEKAALESGEKDDVVSEGHVKQASI